VGSQGDGAAQFLCKSREAQTKVRGTVSNERGRGRESALGDEGRRKGRGGRGAVCRWKDTVK
jgi:hypothetical protein